MPSFRNFNHTPQRPKKKRPVISTHVLRAVSNLWSGMAKAKRQNDHTPGKRKHHHDEKESEEGATVSQTTKRAFLMARCRPDAPKKNYAAGPAEDATLSHDLDHLERESRPKTTCTRKSKLTRKARRRLPPAPVKKIDKYPMAKGQCWGPASSNSV